MDCEFLDVGSGYKPYKNYDTCDVNYGCTYNNVKEIPDNKYTVIRVRNVIHHVKDLKNFISELYRILKPGGRIIIIDSNEKNYNINVFLDNLWYRGILNRYDIYICPRYRNINGKHKMIGGKLWTTLFKN